MILEAHQCASVPTNRDITNTTWHMWTFMNGPGIEDSQATHIRSLCWTIIVCQQLIATADSKYRHIIFDGRPQPDPFYLIQVLGHRCLLFILPSANKQHII